MTGIALIGCGKWGKNYLKTLDALPDARLLYVCDLSEEARQRVTLNFPNVKVVEDYRIALSDSEVAAVIIATPPLSHFEIAANCMTNGKAVLIEKPIASDVAETVKLANIAKQTGQVMMTGHLMLYHPAVEAMKSFIDKGIFGDIKYVTFERTNFNIYRQDIDVLGDLSVHDLAVLLYLFEQQPQWVSAHGISMGTELPMGIVSIDIGFADNALAHIHANWHYHKKTRNISLIGTNGKAIFDDTAEQNRKLTLISDGKIRPQVIEEKEPLSSQCAHFINCVRNNAPARSGPENALQVMRLMETIIFSIIKQRTIYL
ncbi:Gfo/Idh/MocA family oxidoreductase [Peptococcaceae bacterium 1198_IL3148]